MRRIEKLMKGWSFTDQKGNRQAVELPHTWNNNDGQDGGNDYWRGTLVYDNHFDKPKFAEDKERVYLQFHGVNASANIFLNDESVCRHDGGYSTFRVDVTDKLKEDNSIVIEVDNGVNDRVYPQKADFTFYGGIYRDVNLICVNNSHFDLDYFGAPGIAVTPEVAGENAKIHVETYITDFKAGQAVRYTVYDREENVIDTVETTETYADLTINNVRLWNGRIDPYLYCCEAELIENGEVIDNVCTRFGCRTFEIDPENGFILNGKEYPLRGVSRHQDRWGFGNALLPEHHEEDIELICEVGATTIRLAHYQHDQYFYDLCDEKGLVIWAEIPYISKHMPTGRENTISQMKELIYQNYNHPSIVVWGLSNEISIGGSDDDLLENHRILNDLCHELDKTRLTTIAAVSMCKMDDPYLQIPDVVSYNHYFGWYGGETSMNGPWFDKFHEMHPDIPIGCSEYGCEALDWHTSDPKQGDYTEEYQAYYHEELIKQFFTRKYMWATHVWNMFDFGADARNEGGENGQNHKGLVTFDRKYKKDSFYAYKAWLSDEPFVHICSKRYIDRIEDETLITVYSNLPQVELFANGVSVGKETAEDHFFKFIVKNKGETELVAVAGEKEDKSVIRKVEAFNEKYRLVEKGAVLNWFDIDAPDGYLSLNDKMSDIISTPQGQQLFMGLFAKMMGGKNGEEPQMEAMGFEINADMMSMMGGFTALRLFTLMGGMMDVKFTKEELLALNTQLNQIEAPKKN